jgi:methyl-accepting chemotaxis protein
MSARLSILTKIIAVVSFLLFAMTGMNLLAVRNMDAMNANTVDIGTNWPPGVRTPGELRALTASLEERALYDGWSKTLDSYRNATEKVIALSRSPSRMRRTFRC